jgi:allantoinase
VADGFDLVVGGGAVYVDGELRPLDVGVRDGRVAALGAPGGLGPAAAFRDATGTWVLPGFIDAHFHTRAPARPDREDFASGTAAAAAGGVTTLLEMPISTPPAVDAAVLRARRAAIERDAYVDVALYVSSASADPDILAAAVAAGAIAFKAFLQPVPPGREADLGGLCLNDNAAILRALRVARGFDLPCVFHAEDEPIYAALTAELKAAGRRDGGAHAESRPDYVEAIAVGKLLLLAEALDVRLHVPHVSSAMTLDLIRLAKRRRVRVTAETCPHYLAFDDDALVRLGPFAVCNPPLKKSHDRDALWDGLRDGTLDAVTSDHAPFLASEKEAARDDIWRAPPGIPGGEVLGPFMLGAAVDGRLPLARVVDVLAAGPARIFGLAGTKGSLLPGHDADLVLYDPRRPTTVVLDRLQSKARQSATLWEGWAFPGRVAASYVRGAPVYDGSRIVGERGHGRPVAPTSRIG